METLLLQCVDTLDASLKSTLEQLGQQAGLGKLTINQLQYIDAIHLLDQPTITELAEQLDITKPSVTAGVNKLVTLGYVRKIPSTEDKRVVHIELTTAAKTLVSAKYHALQQYGDFIRSALTDQEAQSLTLILTRLVTLFEKSAPNSPH